MDFLGERKKKLSAVIPNPAKTNFWFSMAVSFTNSKKVKARIVIFLTWSDSDMVVVAKRLRVVPGAMGLHLQSNVDQTNSEVTIGKGVSFKNFSRVSESELGPMKFAKLERCSEHKLSSRTFRIQCIYMSNPSKTILHDSQPAV